MAIQDVWFIGDEHLRTIYHHYSTAYKKAKLMDKEGPYVLEHYNVSSHVLGTGNGNRLAISQI